MGDFFRQDELSHPAARVQSQSRLLRFDDRLCPSLFISAHGFPKVKRKPRQKPKRMYLRVSSDAWPEMRWFRLCFLRNGRSYAFPIPSKMFSTWNVSDLFFGLRQTVDKNNRFSLQLPRMGHFIQGVGKVEPKEAVTNETNGAKELYVANAHSCRVTLYKCRVWPLDDFCFGVLSAQYFTVPATVPPGQGLILLRVAVFNDLACIFCISLSTHFHSQSCTPPAPAPWAARVSQFQRKELRE